MPRPERRNLYRLLHVQPEAPAAVLKASYRALMSTLRAHPDLGGGHDQAAELNAAYAVLSDPQRRAQYDQSLRRRTPKRGAAPAAAAGEPEPQRWRERQRCPLCGAATGPLTPRQPRCAACDSPLTPAPSADLAEAELLGRRRGERYVRPQDAMVRTAAQAAAVPARVRDLSMGGLSLLLRVPVRPGQALRVSAASFDAVALVVAVRPQGPRQAVHARLLSLQVLRQARGTLVDEQV